MAADVDAAQITTITADVAVGSGLLSFYSFAADVVTAIPVSAADAVMVAAVTTTTAAAQSSGF